MNNQTIRSDPRVMMGKPCIAGTRITVELILDKLATGESVEQIVGAHPRLTREAIREALAFASLGGSSHLLQKAAYLALPPVA